MARSLLQQAAMNGAQKTGAHCVQPSTAPPNPRPTEKVRERFYRQLMAVEGLPAAPEVATGTLALLERDNCKLAELATYIGGDQVIATALLRLANSVLFGLQGRVTDLQQAVTRLGFARVRDLVVGLSVWQSFEENRARRYALWLHSALVAGAAKTLAQHTGRDAAAAFTGGVVHDVGKLVLGLRLGESYWRLADACKASEAELVAAERHEFGCHHGTVGGWLFQLWRLPPALVDVASRHHDRLAAGQKLDTAALVAIADRLVEGTDPISGTVRDEVFREIESIAPGLVNREQWPALYTRIAYEQQAVACLFG
jgi:HD-like signal output (HDOD) protein